MNGMDNVPLAMMGLFPPPPPFFGFMGGVTGGFSMAHGSASLAGMHVGNLSTLEAIGGPGVLSAEWGQGHVFGGEHLAPSHGEYHESLAEGGGS